MFVEFVQLFRVGAPNSPSRHRWLNMLGASSRHLCEHFIYHASLPCDSIEHSEFTKLIRGLRHQTQNAEIHLLRVEFLLQV